MITSVVPGRRDEPDLGRGGPAGLPCARKGPDLWFAERLRDVELAKRLCRSCPKRQDCLAAALRRAEPWGVWGGEIIIRGSIVATKRGRGRPRRAGTGLSGSR
jgi:WhiB family transcriptional regulator, redox-sensing transcriptional regulator